MAIHTENSVVDNFVNVQHGMSKDGASLSVERCVLWLCKDFDQGGIKYRGKA